MPFEAKEKVQVTIEVTMSDEHANYLSNLTQNTPHERLEDEPANERKLREEIFHGLQKALNSAR